MSYNVVVSPDAFSALKHVQPDVLAQLLPCVFNALADLGRNPVSLGQRSLIPYPEAGQIYYFKCLTDGISHWLSAIFSFDENETDIHVLRVGYRRMVM